MPHSHTFSDALRPTGGISRASAVLVAATGVLSALAWIGGVPQLTALQPRFIPMAPGTALCFATLGGALVARTASRERLWQRLCRIAVVLSLVLAGRALVAFTVGDAPWDIERWLAPDAGMIGEVPLGRMSPITAATLLVAAASLAALARQPGSAVGRLAGVFGVVVFWVGFVVLLGYSYGAPLLHGGRTIPVALSTAIVFAVLGVALVAQSDPASWPLGLLVGPTTTATLHRAFLPVTVSVVLLSGAFHQLVIERYSVNAAVVSAMGAAAAVMVTSIAVWCVARSVGGAIDRAEVTLIEARLALEQRVRERTQALAEANAELQRSQVKLEQAKVEAERANLAKSEFLSRMSHDLRTPLNAIIGFAQVLEMSETDADRTEPVRQILNGGGYLLELVNEVLDITRIESGQLSLSPEPVLVRDVVHRTVELVRPLAVRRGITLTVSPIDAGEAVRADRQRLSQILLNLLSNALKYNSPRGTVQVHTARLAPDRCRIAVTDTGYGIAPSKLALLFKPFERLGAESSSEEGTGLGLALSRALAEAMGGTIGVDSAIDRGSTFWVELAEVADHTASDVSLVRSTSLAQPARRGTVLYVEDNLPNMRLMERIFRQRPGVSLRHAPTAAAAVAAFSEWRPDAVLLDLHLPDMSGEELLRELWQDPLNRTIPTVVVTADATPNVAPRLKAAGARAVLTKPLNIAEVLHVLDELLADVPQPS